MLVDSFQNRLYIAMAMRNKKASELSKETGIAPAQISQYLKGKFKPKNDVLYVIAKALNVSETWLMGMDVPIKRIDQELPSEEKLRIALFGDDIDTTDEMWQEVKEYAQFVKEKHRRNHEKS